MKKASIFLVVILSISLVLAGCKKRKYDDVPVITPSISVDFTQKIRKLKAVNGINNGPKSHADIKDGKIIWALDASELYQELHIPFVRTHDTEYPDGSDAFIDIHCIFPDFTKMSDDKSAYHFKETDEYIKNIIDSGADVIYRLGESIAESVKTATYQNPPEDYQKWAEICEHIIMHYTDSWNDGFTYKINYWEIWNEPDQKRQWSGDLNDYYQLYKTTARYLKKQFPDIKIGAAAQASINENLVKEFLAAINDDGEKTPLDFYDWHLYTNDASKLAYRGNMVRRVLDENGYEKTMGIAGEWNYVDDWENLDGTWEMIRSYKMAAFYSTCLIALQYSDTNGAMYYDGSLTGKYALWCGLYDDSANKLPGYYAFLAYAKLKQIGQQVELTTASDTVKKGIYACAVSGEKDAILIANYNDARIRFQLSTNSEHTRAEMMRVNEEHQDSTTDFIDNFTENEIIEMHPYEMLLIILK